MRSIGIAHIKIVLSWKDGRYILCQDYSLMRFLIQIISWSSVKEGPGLSHVGLGGMRCFYRQEALFVLAAAEGCTAHSSPPNVGQNG